MKILVTGGAGFIGGPLVKRLVTQAEVVILDSLDRQVHSSDQFRPDLAAHARCVRLDLNRLDRNTDLGSIDVVVHLAAQTGTAQSMYALSRYTDANVSGTSRLLEFLLKSPCKPKRIVLASSRAVYGDGVYQSRDGFRTATRNLDQLLHARWEAVNAGGEVVTTLPMQSSQPTEPTSVYGLTKLWQEQLVRNICVNNGIDYAILRFQNVFGPGQAIANPYTGVIGYIAQKLSDNEEVELFEDGLMTRDFLLVDDAVEMIQAAVHYPGTLESTLDAGSGTAVTIRDVTVMMAQAMNKSPNIRVSGRFRAGDVRHAVAETARLGKIFGPLRRTDLKTGIEKYVGWFASQARQPGLHHARAIHELADHGLLYAANSPILPTE